ncbi:MAG: outer membrane lipoprotein carrier protein LolA [Candidatus Eisenbacteria bacterium]|nr:outer membrane lipoprotein carrier protein LolA [Candidatus Eisenbacteria bacterium]
MKLQVHPLRSIPRLFFSFVFSLLLPSGCFCLSSTEIVGKVRSTYDGLKTISFAFVEKDVSSDGRETTVSKGKVAAMLPGKFRVEFSIPKGKVVASDGENLFVSVPGEEPFKVSGGEKLGSSPGMFFVEFLESGKFEASGSEMIGKFGCVKLLGSVEGEEGPVSVSLWIDKKLWVVRQITVEEETGTKKFVLSDISLNPKMAHEVFTIP